MSAWGKTLFLIIIQKRLFVNCKQMIKKKYNFWNAQNNKWHTLKAADPQLNHGEIHFLFLSFVFDIFQLLHKQPPQPALIAMYECLFHDDSLWLSSVLSCWVITYDRLLPRIKIVFICLCFNSLLKNTKNKSNRKQYI